MDQVHTRIAPPVNNGIADEFDYVFYLTRKLVAFFTVYLCREALADNRS